MCNRYSEKCSICAIVNMLRDIFSCIIFALATQTVVRCLLTLTKLLTLKQ